MTYNPADHPYPALRYGANEATRTVFNKDEDEQAHDEGFRDHPSKVGKAVEKPPEAVTTPTPAPAPAKTPKGGKGKGKAPAEKPSEAASAAPAAPEAPAAEVEYDRTAAIARLEAANFEVDPATTDDELKEALAELDKE